jgi:hypothetical protein
VLLYYSLPLAFATTQMMFITTVFVSPCTKLPATAQNFGQPQLIPSSTSFPISSSRHHLRAFLFCLGFIVVVAITVQSYRDRPTLLATTQLELSAGILTSIASLQPIHQTYHRPHTLLSSVILTNVDPACQVQRADRQSILRATNGTHFSRSLVMGCLGGTYSRVLPPCVV